MKRWKLWLLLALSVGMSVFFLAIMRPPGGQSSALGQDRPWQISQVADGATISVLYTNVLFLARPACAQRC